MAFKPTVGLDIGTSQIKAVEVRPGKGRLTITALGVAPTPIGVMQNNLITDSQLMGQAVRQLMRESGITAKRVVGSVAGQSAVVIRIIEVPRMTDAELKETMKWEVERHVPFAPSETVIDYQPLVTPGGTGDANPNMEVLLAVAQQDVIANFVDTVFAAGMDPVAIDIEPLACARALLDLSEGRPIVRPPLSTAGLGEEGYIRPQETVAIVNLGASNTEICIYQDGELAFARPPLPLAGESLTRVIAETLGYSNLEQAERIKRDYAAVQLDRMAIYTGTAYGGGANFDSPQFPDDDQGFTPRRSPSSLRRSGEPQFTDEGFNTPLENPFDFNTSATVFDDMDRTQPIERRTLNLAKVPAPPPDPGLDQLQGVGSPDDAATRDQVFEAIAPVLGELATELRRSLDYYRSRALARSVDRVILTGGSATLVNLAPFLQNELQVPVTVADPMGGLEVMAKHYDPAYLHSIAPVFTIAAGLAVRDAVFEANPVAKKAKATKAPAPAPNAAGTPAS